MNEQPSQVPEDDNKGRFTTGQRIAMGAAAVGLSAAGIAGSDALKSDNDTEPVETQGAAIVVEAQPDEYEKSLPADATKMEPIEITTTTTEEPTTTTTPTTVPAPAPTPTTAPELGGGTQITNPEAPEFEAQKENLRKLLNPQVGEEFTCVLTTRSLEAGSIVKDLDNNDVTLDIAVDVITPTLATSAAREGEENDHGYFFNYGEQQLYIPLTNGEISTVEAKACTVNQVDERGRISSYTPEDGTQVSQPALVAVPRA